MSASDYPIHDEATVGSVGSDAFLDMHGTEGDPIAQKADLLDQMSTYDALLYCHPDYVDTQEKWNKYEDCYEAENIYRFIHRHPRESEDMFQVRVKRGYYYNYCASVVDLLVAYLFHAPIERLPGKVLQDVLDEVYKDADLAGSTYVNFMQDVASFAQIHGHCGVLVDAPQVGVIASEADRKQMNVRPYLTRVKASQIKDWQLDQVGKFEWVKIEIQQDDPRDFSHPFSAGTRHFLIWMKTSWERWITYEDDQEAALIAKGDHSIGVVPLVIFYNEKSKNHRWFGSSQLRDIADINIAILNWSSFGDEEIAERCLNILTMEDGGSDSPDVLSHHNVLTYTAGTQNPPSYLTPGDTPLKLIGEWIDRAKDEIFRISKMAGSTGLLGVREATSGIAYAYEFNETNQSLSKKAEGMEQGELEVHRLIAKWMNKEFDGQVAYPREFGVDDFNMELAILLGARTTLTSDTAKKELEKRLTAKMFARSDSALRAKIKDEVDAADPNPMMGVAESFGTIPKNMARGNESEKET